MPSHSARCHPESFLLLSFRAAPPFVIPSRRRGISASRCAEIPRFARDDSDAAAPRGLLSFRAVPPVVIPSRRRGISASRYAEIPRFARDDSTAAAPRRLHMTAWGSHRADSCRSEPLLLLSFRAKGEESQPPAAPGSLASLGMTATPPRRADFARPREDRAARTPLLSFQAFPALVIPSRSTRCHSEPFHPLSFRAVSPVVIPSRRRGIPVSRCAEIPRFARDDSAAVEPRGLRMTARRPLRIGPG
jgi:hypothetical protein